MALLKLHLKDVPPACNLQVYELEWPWQAIDRANWDLLMTPASLWVTFGDDVTSANLLGEYALDGTEDAYSEVNIEIPDGKGDLLLVTEESFKGETNPGDQFVTFEGRNGFWGNLSHDLVQDDGTVVKHAEGVTEANTNVNLYSYGPDWATAQAGTGSVSALVDNGLFTIGAETLADGVEFMLFHFELPEAYGTIYPAPEALPHKFSERDFPGFGHHAARSMARKLNDNFDAIERQLMSLDVDAEKDKNPSGVDS